MITPNPSKSLQEDEGAREYQQFLLAVVNAEDRAKSTGTRRRFQKIYRDWFPPDMKGEHAANGLRALLYAYSIPHMWKCRGELQHPHVPFTFQKLSVFR